MIGQFAETAGVQIGYLGELAPTARTRMLHTPTSPPQTTNSRHTGLKRMVTEGS